jgi:hypothetical protein
VGILLQEKRAGQDWNPDPLAGSAPCMALHSDFFQEISAIEVYRFQRPDIGCCGDIPPLLETMRFKSPFLFYGSKISISSNFIESFSVV